MSNWDTLNRKVMAKMNYQIPRDLCERICRNEPGVVEAFLFDLKVKLEIHMNKKNAAAQKDKGNTNMVDFKGVFLGTQLAPK